MNKGKLLLILLLAACCLIAVPLGASAEDAAPDTPEYSNDFTSEDLSDFTSVGGLTSWKVVDGALVVKAKTSDTLLFGGEDWTNYTAEYDFKTTGGNCDGGFVVYKDATHLYQISVRSFGWAPSGTGNLLEIYEGTPQADDDTKVRMTTVADSKSFVNGASVSIEPGETVRIKIVVKPDLIRVFCNNQLFLDYLVPETGQAPAGRAGFTLAGSKAEIDNLVIRAVTEQDLAPAEPPENAGGAVNKHITITTRSGQNEQLAYGTDPGFRAVAIAMIAVGFALVAVYWGLFLVTRFSGKKK